jgi:hypothetical protein
MASQRSHKEGRTMSELTLIITTGGIHVGGLRTLDSGTVHISANDIYQIIQFLKTERPGLVEDALNSEGMFAP